LFKNRSVIEIMVITFTFVVAWSLIGLGAMIVIVEARNPEADTGIIANTLMSLVSGILGALLGLIAGKSGAGTAGELSQRPSGEPDDVATKKDTG
jgi:branched-subunit amino acid ABC-type transport system permease component